MRVAAWVGIASAVLPLATPARAQPIVLQPIVAQSIVRISQSSAGVAGDYYSWCSDRTVSAGGRYVVFLSFASNLTRDANGNGADVFVRDLALGTTELLCRSASGAQSNGPSEDSTVSADGRWAAFSSGGTNLIVPDANSTYEDVYVRDLSTGAVERVDVSSSGVQGILESVSPSISSDGLCVAFRSSSGNLVPGTPTTPQIYVRDRGAGTTVLASQGPNAPYGNDFSESPSISGDGRLVAFLTRATNLLGSTDANGHLRDVLVRDVVAGTTELVSRSTAGAQGDSECFSASISADGRFVAFASQSDNLVPGDTNGQGDVFVRDLQSGTTEMMSVDSTGRPGDGPSATPSISADGRFVAFASGATNFPGSGSWIQIYVRDRLRNTLEVVSRNDAGNPANSHCRDPAISADGRHVAFSSSATNLAAPDGNGQIEDVYLVDRGPEPPFAHCFGDGTAVPCPCGNTGQPGRGCENAASTGGALLAASGSSALSADTLVLSSAFERTGAFTLFFQGTARIPPVSYGDGLRCTAGSIARLYVENAIGGTAVAPRAGELSVSLRSIALGSPIPVGATRHYQAYYRDPLPTFCPPPQGSTWNASNALSVVWGD